MASDQSADSGAGFYLWPGANLTFFSLPYDLVL